MGKKVVLAVFGGVALLGILTAIVGFAMGGGGGSLNVRDGHWVYHGREGTVQLGTAPHWAQRWNNSNWHLFNFRGGWNAVNDAIDDAFDDVDDDDWDDNYNDGYNYEYNYSYDYDYHFTPGSNKVDDVAPPVSANQLTKIDIDISAGFVVVKTGDEPGLKVEGPLEYRTYMDEGVWHIKSDHNGLQWRSAAFWLNGRNMSTKFTVTVPAYLADLEVNINAGDANLRDLEVGELDVSAGAATISLTDITADSIDLSAQAGQINAENVSAAEADFNCQAGDINFDGALSGKVEAECQAGDLSIITVRPADYGWKARASMGSISIDGSNVSGLSSDTTGGNQSALPYFDLDCSAGSITIVFK